MKEVVKFTAIGILDRAAYTERTFHSASVRLSAETNQRVQFSRVSQDGGAETFSERHTTGEPMQRFEVDDRIRVDIPDETDPDHEQYHGVLGTVMEVLKDDAGHTTGDERDSFPFKVELDTGEKHDFRWRDLRPV